MEPNKNDRNLGTVGDLEHFAMLVKARLRSGIDTSRRTGDDERTAEMETDLEVFDEQVRLILEEVQTTQAKRGADYNRNTELEDDPYVLANYLFERYSS